MVQPILRFFAPRCGKTSWSGVVWDTRLLYLGMFPNSLKHFDYEWMFEPTCWWLNLWKVILPKKIMLNYKFQFHQFWNRMSLSDLSNREKSTHLAHIFNTNCFVILNLSLSWAVTTGHYIVNYSNTIPKYSNLATLSMFSIIVTILDN